MSEELIFSYDVDGPLRVNGLIGPVGNLIALGENLTLWVVGEYIGSTDDDVVAWDLVGVFLDEQSALAACIKPTHFIGPVKLNEAVHERAAPWPGAYFPHEKEAP